MALPLIPALGAFLKTAGGGALAGAALPYIPDLARSAYNTLIRPAAGFIDKNLFSLPELPRWLSSQEQSQQQFESSPERQLQKQLMEQYSNQGNQPSFEPIRQRALQDYEERIKPALMERFVGMGSYGSSPYYQALNRGERDLQTQLAALESEWQRGGEGNRLQQLANLGSYLTGQQQLGLASQQAQAGQQQAMQEMAFKQLGLGQQKSQSDIENMIKVILANQQRAQTGLGAAIDQAKLSLQQQKQPVISRGQRGIAGPIVNSAIKGFVNPFSMIQG